MTHEQYALYSRIFDALLEARAIDRLISIQLHGNLAGAALRTWASARRIDVTPDIGELPDCTWTRLTVMLPDDVSWFIIVHLDDRIPTATAQVSQPAETEIPF